jgi:8-oxo-dGTP pyrophosphatase MutT (NUDIX family)
MKKKKKPAPESLKSCGVLIVRGDPIHSFLLMIHKKRFDLPKGHTEPGETELECALRELEEETGITADDVRLDPNFRFAIDYKVRYKKKYGDVKIPKTTVIFLGYLINEVEIRVTEHPDYEWREWNPPHSTDSDTIDGALQHLQQFLANAGRVA